MVSQNKRLVFSSTLACVGLLLMAFPALLRADGNVASVGDETTKQPQELGRVSWLRGLDKAKQVAAEADKPILILFQEVPGCHTCVTYGDRVLSHPLIVDAAETLFVPVAVFNNIKGEDERTLKLYKEPAWNNPVVRIVSSDAQDVLPRLADDYTVGGLANGMAMALKKSNRTVPTYLSLLAEEALSRRAGLKRATFAMHCFWEGEVALGTVPGVVATTSGFVGDTEVVDVEFDPARIEFSSLMKEAIRRDCASHLYTRSEEQYRAATDRVPHSAIRLDENIRADKQPKYHLFTSTWRFVPMTSLQAARANALLAGGRSPSEVLSPRQLALHNVVTRHPNAGWPVALPVTDFVSSWNAAARLMDQIEGRRK